MLADLGTPATPLQMNQQPAGTYGLQEHVTRVAISLLVPCLVYLGYAVLKKVRGCSCCRGPVHCVGTRQADEGR